MHMGREEPLVASLALSRCGPLEANVASHQLTLDPDFLSHNKILPAISSFPI
jgi:hypothetical protein